MKLILIRSPQLFFYKMKSKKEDKEHDDGYMTYLVSKSLVPLDFCEVQLESSPLNDLF